MLAYMNGYIIETTVSNEDIAHGEVVRWIGISHSAKSMIALLEGHSPSVVDRGSGVLARARSMGLKDSEIRQLDDGPPQGRG